MSLDKWQRYDYFSFESFSKEVGCHGPKESRETEKDKAQFKATGLL
jgi:hypothetical protein